jgi:hypothetical protein
MPTILQLRRGNTSQTTAFTGASGEISYDTDKRILVAHDGSTPGGVPLAREAHLAAAYTTANSAYNFANTRFASAGGTVSGDVTVTGNLIVSGNVTTINADNLSIEDNMIYLNHGLSKNTYPDLGFVANYSNGISQHTGLFRDQTDGFWKFFDGYLPAPGDSIFLDTANASFRLAPVVVSSITATTSNVGTVQTGTWQGSSISSTYTDAKTVSVGGQTGVISNTQLLNFLIAVDGLGSGLDADLLDGQQGSFYQNANNINAGLIATARLASSEANSQSYLRGDRQWVKIQSSGASTGLVYFMSSFL